MSTASRAVSGRRGFVRMLDALEKLYDAYTGAYSDEEGRLPPMMELKRVHTRFVVENASQIAESEGFDPATREAVLAAALLHDTGRYEQLRLYNTFRDSDSVDHAVFSHDIVRERGWLDDLCDDETRDAVLKAVLYHNRRELPGSLGALASTCSHAVRDADKLDIFRVAEERISNTDWRADTTAFWNLSAEAPPNPEVVECILASEPVDYQMIGSLSDFILIQVGWMISGLHYASSRRLCRERGHLAFRRDFLHSLTLDPAVDRICDFARERL